MVRTLLGKVALTPKGVFNANKEGGYARLDVVTDGTQSYVSLKDNNNSALTDTNAWMQYMNVTVEGGSSSQSSSFVTETDYSESFIGHLYFDPNNLNNILESGTHHYPMTDFIPVEQGDTVIFSGDRGALIPFIVGYNSAKENPQELLGDNLLGGEGTQVSNYSIVIPSGVHFIKCCAKEEGHPSGLKYKMTIKVWNTHVLKNIVTGLETTELAKRVFIPKGKKIMVLGASFASTSNGWDKILQDTTGIEVINKAVGSTNLSSHVVPRLLDASISQPHGSLFMKDNKDIFDDIGAVIIMYTHNQDILLSEAEYKSRDAKWYRDNYSQQVSGDIKSSWDYVIKQLKEWSGEHHNITDNITVDGIIASRENDIVDNQLQILICSHWLPSRAIYNESSRKLAERHGLAYCPLDKELGFTKDDKVHGTFQTDQNGHVATEGYYNRSVLHSEFVNVATSGNENVPIGRTERIDGIIWGWHPQQISESLNYGYGKVTTRDGTEMYVPWIQQALSQAIISCLNYCPIIEEIN